MSMDQWFFVISGILIAVLVLAAVASIVFLSTRVLRGFTAPEETRGGVKFNLEEYRDLNLPGS